VDRVEVTLVEDRYTELCLGPEDLRERHVPSKILARRDGFDGSAVAVSLDQGAHIHDALALLPRDLGPVIRIGRVR